MATYQQKRERGQVMPKLEDYELEEQYKEFLNEIHPLIVVCGMEYDPADALYKLDPIAYRVGFSDWLDGLDNCEGCEKNPIECDCEGK